MQALEEVEDTFVLRDRKGGIRAKLHVKPRGRRELSLYDGQGQIRGGMTIRADGTTTLSLYGRAGHTRVLLITHKHAWPANLYLYAGEYRVELTIPDYAIEEFSFHTKAGFPFAIPQKARGGLPYLELWGLNSSGVIYLAPDRSAVLALRSKKKESAEKRTSRRRSPASRAGREVLRVALIVEPGGLARLILRHKDGHLRGVLRVEPDGELGLDLDD